MEPSSTVTTIFSPLLTQLRTPVAGAEVMSIAALETVLCCQEKWEETENESGKVNIPDFLSWVEEAYQESLNGGKTGFSLVKERLSSLFTSAVN